MNKIEVNNLNKKFDHFALKNVNFSIPKGYVTGFIGKNGMGKTTTIKSILSMITYEGNITIESEDTSLPHINQEIGVIMDDSFLAKDWTMRYVNEAMKVGYDKWDEAQFFTYLRDFNIDEQLKVKELSRGMKIKLMLSIALSHKANILILDEPTSGLDPSMRDEFLDLIQHYVVDPKHTVLFSTHITQDLEAIADYIVFIDKGKIVLATDKDTFMNYFMIIKGPIEQFDLIDPNIVLGKKLSKFNCELLVKRADIQTIPGEFIEEEVSIDRIMILFEG